MLNRGSGVKLNGNEGRILSLCHNTVCSGAGPVKGLANEQMLMSGSLNVKPLVCVSAHEKGDVMCQMCPRPPAATP